MGKGVELLFDGIKYTVKGISWVIGKTFKGISFVVGKLFKAIDITARALHKYILTPIYGRILVPLYHGTVWTLEKITKAVSYALTKIGEGLHLVLVDGVYGRMLGVDHKGCDLCARHGLE